MVGKAAALLDRWATSGSLVGGAAAALGAAACCAGPLLLVVLGVGGAWGARLVALSPYQPYFIGAALACFGFAFYRLYRKPGACAPGAACARPPVLRRQRIIGWATAAGATALVAFPLYAPRFL